MNRIDKTFTRLGKKQSTQITKTRSERHNQKWYVPKTLDTWKKEAGGLQV
jgi:hypothetical protein